MKPRGFAYHRPGTVPEAVRLLGALPNACVLAGGQSLLPMLNLRVAMPDHVIDINRIPGLDAIDEGPGRVRIGAMARQASLLRSPAIARHLPLLAQALRHVGHEATRARGTLGGSLCHLDPAAELPAVALAYDAVMHLEGPAGGRGLAAADFMRGPMTTALAAGEMLAAVEWTKWPAPHGSGFAEFSPRHGDFAVVLCAVLLLLSATGRVQRAAIVLGGMGDAPVRVTAAENTLIGAAPTEAACEAAAAACATIPAAGDAHYPAWYRQRLAVVMARRALAAARAGPGA